MRVQFTYTQDDMVDASKRFLARSKVVRSWGWQGVASIAFLAWLLAFLMFFGTPLKGALIGLIAAAVCALIYPGIHKRTIEKRLRKLCKEKFGDTNVFTCEVELRPTGLWTQANNTQTISEWEMVEEILETEDSVDIFTRQGGGVVVRNRAFKSADEKQQFIDLARSYLESGRQDKVQRNEDV